MLFGRREPASWWEIFRISIWPRRSWARSGKYVAKRILRLTASPHAIAAGVAAGVFASFTPFLGFHFVIAFIVSYIIAGNFLAAAMGTFFGNPFTFPLIWASTFTTGRFILTGASHAPGDAGAPHDRLGEISHTDVLAQGIGKVLENIARLWDPVVKPMMIGAIPLGILAGIAAYVLTRWIAIGFRAARKKQLASKAIAQQKRLEQAKRTGAADADAAPDRQGRKKSAAPDPATESTPPAQKSPVNNAESPGEALKLSDVGEANEPRPLPEPAEGSR